MSGVTLQTHGEHNFSDNEQVLIAQAEINMQPISRGRRKLFSCKCTLMSRLKRVFFLQSHCCRRAGRMMENEDLLFASDEMDRADL